MMNGSGIIQLVYDSLNEDDHVSTMIAEFCEDNVDADVIAAVVAYIP